MRLLTCRLPLVVTIGLIATTILSGHAELIRMEPSAGSVLPSGPSRVKLWFSEPVDAPAGAVTVVGPDGVRLDRRDGAVAPDDPTALEATLDARATGTYTVRWRAVSADSHPITGSFQFSVGAPSAVAEAAAPAPPQESSGIGLQAFGRWVHLIALVILVGPIVLSVITGQHGQHGDSTFTPGLMRLSRGGALLLLPGALVGFVAQAGAISGSVADALNLETVIGLLRTSWGMLWAARAALAVAIATLSIVITRRGQGLDHRLLRYGMLALAAILIWLTTLNGHSGATDPVWLSVTIDWLHTAAAAVWIGGLIALVAVVLPRVRRLPAGEQTRILSTTAIRFSTLALICVELLILTGLYHAWAHVSGPPALVSTDYGRALLVKLGLIAIMLVPGAVNLLVLRPRFRHAAAAPDRSEMGESASEEPAPPPAPTINAGQAAPIDKRPPPLFNRRPAPLIDAFSRMVRAEAAIGVVVLAVVGVLTSLPPASPESRPAAPVEARAPAPSVSLADHAGDTLVTFRLSPGSVGANRVEIALDSAAAERPRDAQLRLRIEPPPGSGISQWSVTPAKEGDRYHAMVALSPAGRWGLEASLANPDRPVERAKVFVTVPVIGAAELLGAAAGAMNALRSMVEETEVIADAGRSAARIEYQAPDRQRIAAEMPEIRIGAVGYMRHGDEWVEHPGESFRWPAYGYVASARDVSIIGREPVDGVDCFVVGFVDTRDGSHQRLWIATQGLLARRQSSMAPGRFVTSRFSGFNVPVDIKPPVTKVPSP